MSNGRAGKGKRVLGVFAVLLGGGVLLESSVRWLGIGVAVLGISLLLWGFAEMRDTDAGDC